jgi:hypothetical protein
MNQALSGTAPIKVEDLIKRIKSEFCRENVQPEDQEPNSVEKAFMQFYRSKQLSPLTEEDPKEQLTSYD